MAIYKPKVSVILSTKDQAQYLSEALESIIHQNYKNLEILITDDGSKDQTKAILEKYKKNNKIKIFYNQKPLGLTKNLIKMIDHATGDFICRHDSDDFSESDRISKQVKVFKLFPKTILVFSDIKKIDENKKNEKINSNNENIYSEELRANSLNNGNIIVHGSVMFKKEYYYKSGGYDRDFIYSQDFDLWQRLIKLGSFRRINRKLYNLRLHKKSISEVKKNLQNIFAIFAILKNDKKSFKIFIKFLIQLQKNIDHNKIIDRVHKNIAINVRNEIRVRIINNLIRKGELNIAKLYLNEMSNLFLKIIFLIIVNKKIYSLLKKIYRHRMIFYKFLYFK